MLLNKLNRMESMFVMERQKMIDFNERERMRAKARHIEDQNRLEKQMKERYEEQMRVVQIKSEEVVREDKRRLAEYREREAGLVRMQRMLEHKERLAQEEEQRLREQSEIRKGYDRTPPSLAAYVDYPSSTVRSPQDVPRAYREDKAHHARSVNTSVNTPPGYSSQTYDSRQTHISTFETSVREKNLPTWAANPLLSAKLSPLRSLVDEPSDV